MTNRAEPHEAALRVELERAYLAAYRDDFGAIGDSIAHAREIGAGGDVRVRFLEFMVTWYTVELDEDGAEQLHTIALELLAEAAKLPSPVDAARVVLDVAEVVVFAGEPEQAESALRQLCARDDLDDEAALAARVLWAEIALDYDEDPTTALEVLDTVPPSLRSEADYVGLRAAALVELERVAEARSLLESAISRDDDTGLRHQLGLALWALGEHELAQQQLLEVHRRDLAEHEIQADAEPDPEDAEQLRSVLAELLASLPSGAWCHVEATPIRIERWPSQATVMAGGDPRSAIWFSGVSDDHVDGIVVYADVVALEADDDRLVEFLTLCLSREFRRLFDLELPFGM